VVAFVKCLFGVLVVFEIYKCEFLMCFGTVIIRMVDIDNLIS